MPVSIYEVLWIFFIYGFLGWCTEVSYHALNTGKFVNRGFLNGPICPIYGVGVLVVVITLNPLKEHLLILFFGSVALTTAIEFVTGFLLEKLFHNQWWDYSDQPFNLFGYICLKFSFLWGMACTMVLDVLHPIIYKAIHLFPVVPGIVMVILLLLIFVTDLSITVASVLKLNKHLRLLDEISRKIKGISDEIGENIFENVTGAMEKGDGVLEALEVKKEWLLENVENVKENFQEKREEAILLQKKYKELLEKKNMGQTRLLIAFPSMKSKIHPESLKRLKLYVKRKKERQEKKR